MKQPKQQKSLVASPFTEVRVHGTACIHTHEGKECGKPAVRTQQGWLCEEHERKVFR